MDCDLALDEWLMTWSKNGSITGYSTTTSTAYVNTYTSWYNTNNYTITLCDGVPRIQYTGGKPAFTSDVEVISHPETVSVRPLRASNTPCSIPTGEVSAHCQYITPLLTASSRASVSAYQKGTYLTGRSVSDLACPLSSGVNCALMVQSAHLMYWPVAPRPSGLCGPSSPWKPLNISGPSMSTTINGTGYTSPTVYDPPQLLTVAPALTEPQKAPAPTLTLVQPITSDAPAPSAPADSPARPTTSAGPAPSPSPQPKTPSNAQQQDVRPTSLADDLPQRTTTEVGLGGAIESMINRPPVLSGQSSKEAGDPAGSFDTKGSGNAGGNNVNAGDTPIFSPGIGAAIISMINLPPWGSRPTKSNSGPIAPFDPFDPPSNSPISSTGFTPAQLPQAMVSLPSTTLTIVREPNNANVLLGTTFWPGDVATVGTHTLSINTAGVVVDGNTTGPIPFITPNPAPVVHANAPAPHRAVISIGDHTTTLLRGPNNAVTVNGQVQLPGAVVTLSGHTLSFAEQGLVVDGTSTALFGPGPTLLPAIVAVAGQTIVLGGAAVTAAGKVVSYGSKGLVFGTETIAVPTAAGLVTLKNGEVMRVGAVTGLPGGRIGEVVGGVLAGQGKTGAASVPLATSGTDPVGKVANVTASVGRSTSSSAGVGRQSATSSSVPPSTSFPASSGAADSSMSSYWMTAVIGFGAIAFMYI
ncbi:hypothetical protein B9Z65_1685 [Elsinoe australis]|uniref:Uncharacterized protein n=1 Tax=Elsinoe australis TaxID=40998 RepID=A0A2P7YGL2_9PEZI|nr:hypothetical protein B9Z65_1685 [Elsinoe australis]